MSKHTLGPWSLRDTGYIHTTVEGYEYDGFVALMRATCANDRWEADARLITAAPDLLSIAMRWAALDGGAWHAERHAREKAELVSDTKAAIAKAEGVSA